MNTQPWHCEPGLLRRYLDGGTDMVLSASIEAHLIGCADCRAAVAALSDPVPLQRAWAGVRETIQHPRLPVTLRVLRWLGLTEEDAVLLSASWSIRGPWALGTAAVLAFAVLAGMTSDRIADASYLIVAPLAPVLGVVSAFASHTSAELTNTTSYSKFRLASLRTAAVTISTVPTVTLTGAILPGVDWLAVAWLGPAIGLTLAALVLLTWLPAKLTGAVLAGAWILVIMTAYAQHDVAATVRPPAQFVYAGLAGLAAAGLAVRIRSARTPGGYA